jgi:hypothetical protein
MNKVALLILAFFMALAPASLHAEDAQAELDAIDQQLLNLEMEHLARGGFSAETQSKLKVASRTAAFACIGGVCGMLLGPLGMLGGAGISGRLAYDYEKELAEEDRRDRALKTPDRTELLSRREKILAENPHLIPQEESESDALKLIGWDVPTLNRPAFAPALLKRAQRLHAHTMQAAIAFSGGLLPLFLVPNESMPSLAIGSIAAFLASSSRFAGNPDNFKDEIQAETEQNRADGKEVKDLAFSMAEQGAERGLIVGACLLGLRALANGGF